VAVQPVNMGRLTQGIAIVTFACWAIPALFGWDDAVALLGGFIPARMNVGAPDLPFAVPAFLTPLSATFIHGGLLHLVSNLLALVYCGREVERVLGWKATATLYYFSAYAAAIGQYVVDPIGTQPMIGASGAISGIVGTYAMVFSQKRPRRIGPIPGRYVHMLWLAAAWVGIQWLTGIAAAGGGYNIAIAAHICGFLAGLFLARGLLAWRYRDA
jgi:membrane associated rhomboid family serine protease